MNNYKIEDKSMTKKKRMYAQNNPKIKKPAYNEDDFAFLKKRLS